MDLPRIVQREYLTRKDVLADGGNDRDIREARKSGEITVIRAGVYVPTSIWQHLSAGERQRVVTHAVLDRLGDGYAGTHASAVAEHDISLYGNDPGLIHVTHRAGGKARRENRIVFHEGPISDDDLVCIDGRLYAKPARALWEHAMTVGPEEAVVSLDSALHLKKCSMPQLAEFHRAFMHWAGSRTARLAMLLCDGRAGSVGESRSRYKFFRYSIPKPELQYEVRNSSGTLIAVTDFAWLKQRHIGEFDGKLKYDMRSEWVEDPKFEVVKEKYREDAVRDELFGFSRWGWQHLDPPYLEPWLKGLLAKLDRSEHLYGRNAVHIPLS